MKRIMLLYFPASIAVAEATMEREAGHQQESDVDAVVRSGVEEWKEGHGLGPEGRQSKR